MRMRGKNDEESEGENDDESDDDFIDDLQIFKFK